MVGARSTDCMAFIEIENKNRMSASPSFAYGPGAFSATSIGARHRRHRDTASLKRAARTYAADTSLALVKKPQSFRTMLVFCFAYVGPAKLEKEIQRWRGITGLQVSCS